MKATRVFAAVAALTFVLWNDGSFSPPTAASAAVVNVDIEGGTADTTHAGADGIFSTTGRVWNGVPTNVNTLGLLDEFGSATPFGANFSRPADTFGQVDPASSNNLQDSGIQTTGFQITGLLPGASYDLAGYIGFNGGFTVVDATGDRGFVGFGSPTYALPGIETISGGQRGDYVLFSGLIPANLGGGNFGVTISTDGTLTGLQIRGAVPEPATLFLFASALLPLAWWRRRDRTSWADPGWDRGDTSLV